MSLAYLLDTNIVSELLRPSSDQHLQELLKQNEHELAIASLVWHKLLLGYDRLPNSTKKRAIDGRQPAEPMQLNSLTYDEGG